MLLLLLLIAIHNAIIAIIAISKNILIAIHNAIIAIIAIIAISKNILIC